MSQWIRTTKREAIYRRDKYTCQLCGKEINDRANLTLDHVKSRKRGGSNEVSNLVTACVKCNCSKADKTIGQWIIDKSARDIVWRRINNARQRKLQW